MVANGFREIAPELPDVRNPGVVDLGSTVGAGIGVAEVALNIHLGDNRNPALEARDKVRVEYCRRKTAVFIGKGGALIDIYVRMREVSRGQRGTGKQMGVACTQVVAIRYLGV